MSRFLMSLIMVLSTGVCWTVSVATAGSGSDPRSASLATKSALHRAGEGSVRRDAVTEVTPDLIRMAIQKYLEGEWGQRVTTVLVTVLEPSEPVVMSGGAVELQVLPSSTEEGPGRRVFHVAAVIPGHPRKTIQVVADVSATIDAVVPTRLLRADELIDAEDLRTARIRVHQVNHPFITDQAEVIGKSAARPLPPDAPLRSAFVRLPVVIKKGDRVLIEARRGGLSIRAYGITKSSGQVGQTVLVANLDSGRELRAKVVAPSLVLVEF